MGKIAEYYKVSNSTFVSQIILIPLKTSNSMSHIWQNKSVLYLVGTVDVILVPTWGQTLCNFDIEYSNKL